MTDNSNDRIVVLRIGGTFTTDDLRQLAQQEPDKYLFDEETGELLQKPSTDSP